MQTRRKNRVCEQVICSPFAITGPLSRRCRNQYAKASELAQLQGNKRRRARLQISTERLVSLFGASLCIRLETGTVTPFRLSSRTVEQEVKNDPIERHRRVG